MRRDPAFLILLQRMRHAALAATAALPPAEIPPPAAAPAERVAA